MEWFDMSPSASAVVAAFAFFCLMAYMMWPAPEPVDEDGDSDDERRRAFVRPPVPPPRDFTVADLAQYDGEDGRPMYTACNGVVFDMSSHYDGKMFYSKGQGYNCFIGRDASLMFARLSLDPKDADGDKTLSMMERDAMDGWYDKFMMKYNVVGYVTDGVFPKSVAQVREAEEAEVLRERAAAEAAGVPERKKDD